MKSYDAYTDDDGVKWELLYERNTKYILSPDGEVEREFEVIEHLTYRREGDTDYVPLPPWATVRDDAKITLCFFEEDEETEELTFMEVR